jgi:predicted component of type VI protein secretion system
VILNLPAMELILHILHPYSRAKPVRIAGSSLIGRAAECQVRLALPEISRKHCQVTFRNRMVLVRDLGSANGTRLDGKTIPHGVDHVLEPGMVIELGPLSCRVEILNRTDEDPGTVVGDQEETRHPADWPAAGSCLDEETAVRRPGRGDFDPGQISDSGESSMELPAIEVLAEDFGRPPPLSVPASTADADDPALEDFLKKISD